MLDFLILRFLSKKGKIAYFIGQILLIIIAGFLFYGITGESILESRESFLVVIISIVISWGVICILIWRKPKEEDEKKIED